MVKSRAYKNDKSAIYTLNYCLDNILKLLSPVIPLITYKIYKDLRNKDIHFEKFPKIENKYKLKFSTKDLIELNSRIWKEKKDNGLSLNSELKKLTLPLKFKSISKEIKETHNAKEINFGKEFKIEF